MTSRDLQYIQYLDGQASDYRHIDDVLKPKASGGVTLLQCNSRQLGQILRCRPDLLASSKPFRYATLAFVSSAMAPDAYGHPRDLHTCDYMANFYLHTRAAITTLSPVDLVYACSMILVYVLSTNPKADKFRIHLDGLHKSLLSLKNSPGALKEIDMFFAQLLWVHVLRLLRIHLYAEIKRTSGYSIEIVRFADLSDKISEVSELFAEIGQPDRDIQLPTERFRLFETIIYYDLLLALGCMLTPCIQQYVALRCVDADPFLMDSVGNSLQTTLRMITSRIPPSSHPIIRRILATAAGRNRSPEKPAHPLWDEWLLQTYGLAWVVKQVFFNSKPVLYNTDAQNGAKFLSKLLSVKHISWFAAFDMECLFWSGVVLTGSLDPTGMILMYFC
jgi:hypothetical protein